MAQKRTQKLPKLLELIAKHLSKGTYLDTRHARDRGLERQITRAEILYVLRNGYHEKARDRWEEDYLSPYREHAKGQESHIQQDTGIDCR